MELKIKSINIKAFNDLIKKLISIDPSVYILIGPEKIESSVYTQQQDAVKVVEINTEDIFEIEDDFEPIKVSFFNGGKIIEALNFYANNEISGLIKYDEYRKEFLAQDFFIMNDDLEIQLYCADPKMDFMQMNQDEKERAFSTDTCSFEFSLDSDKVRTINSLFKLDRKVSDSFEIKCGKIKNDINGVYIIGKNYSHLVNEIYDEKSLNIESVILYKKKLEFLDDETYMTSVCENKVIFESQNSNTKLSVSVCIDEDEDFDLDSTDLDLDFDL
jgi:hypothetical protein